MMCQPSPDTENFFLESAQASAFSASPRYRLCFASYPIVIGTEDEILRAVQTIKQTILTLPLWQQSFAANEDEFAEWYEQYKIASLARTTASSLSVAPTAEEQEAALAMHPLPKPLKQEYHIKTMLLPGKQNLYILVFHRELLAEMRSSIQSGTPIYVPGVYYAGSNIPGFSSIAVPLSGLFINSKLHVMSPYYDESMQECIQSTFLEVALYDSKSGGRKALYGPKVHAASMALETLQAKSQPVLQVYPLDETWPVPAFTRHKCVEFPGTAAYVVYHPLQEQIQNLIETGIDMRTAEREAHKQLTESYIAEKLVKLYSKLAQDVPADANGDEDMFSC